MWIRQRLSGCVRKSVVEFGQRRMFTSFVVIHHRETTVRDQQRKINRTKTTLTGNVKACHVKPTLDRLNALYNKLEYKDEVFRQSRINELLKHSLLSNAHDLQLITDFVIENKMFEHSVLYNLVLKCMQIHGNEASAAIVKQLVHTSGNISEFYFNLIMELIKNEHLEYAIAVYNIVVDEIQSKMLKLAPFQFNLLICAAINNQYYDFAKSMINYCRKLVIHFSVTDQAKRIHAYLNVLDIESAISMYNRITGYGRKLIGQQVYTSLLNTIRTRLYETSNNLDYFHQILASVQQLLDISQMDKQLLHSVLDAYAELGQSETLSQYLTKIQEAGISLDEHMINAMLYCLGRNGQLEEALSLLMIAESSYGVKPNNYMFTTVLSSCDTETQVDTVLAAMKKYCIAVDTTLLNSTLKALVRSNISHALSLYERMKRSETTKPDNYTFITLVKALHSDPQTIDQLYRDCMNLKVKPNQDLMHLFMISNILPQQLTQLLIKGGNQAVTIHQRYPDLFHLLLDQLEGTPNYELVKRRVELIQNMSPDDQANS